RRRAQAARGPLPGRHRGAPGQAGGRTRPRAPARVGDRRGRLGPALFDAQGRCPDHLAQADAAAVAAPVHDRARGAADALQRGRGRIPREPREARAQVTRIHQVLSGAGPVDAVTTQAFEYRSALASWGMDGDIHAALIEPAVRASVQPLSELRPDPDDLLLFHYFAYAPRLEPLLDWPQRKLLVYHNVTPAEWLWEYQPHVATLCALGRDHLPRWARAVDVAAAVSECNAEELRAAGARDVRVVPIVFRPERLDAQPR